MKQGERFGFNYVPPMYPLHIGGDGFIDFGTLAVIMAVDSVSFVDSTDTEVPTFKTGENFVFSDGGTI